MRKIRRRQTRARNQESPEQPEEPKPNGTKEETRGRKKRSPEAPEPPIRNASEPSVQHFWAESSDKGLSAQYLRPNFQPIYHVAARTGTGRNQVHLGRTEQRGAFAGVPLASASLP